MMPSDISEKIEAALENRSCGSCSECCVRLHVDTPEFKKAGGVPC
jgi:hypothetical protein